MPRDPRDRDRCAERGNEADGKHAANGRPMAQRIVELCVAEEQPWKAGEEPRQRPLERNPARAEADRVHPAIRPSHPTRVCERERRRKPRHRDHEERDQGTGEPRRRRTVVVNADVDPRRADAVFADAERPTEHRRARRFRFVEHAKQHRDRNERKRPQVERRQRKRQRRAGEYGEPERAGSAIRKHCYKPRFSDPDRRAIRASTGFAGCRR